MPRYPHYITRVHGDKWPARVICVDCVGRLEPASYSNRVEHEELVSWHAQSLALKDGKYAAINSISAVSAVEWWTRLCELCGRGPSVWILSYRACRNWSLLGLWEKLENGEISLKKDTVQQAQVATSAVCTVRDYRVNSSCLPAGASVRAMPSKNGGILVCEDPPSIAVFRFRGKGPWVTWVDVRNYSACPMEGCANGTGAAHWMAEWFCEWYQGLSTYKMGTLQHTSASQAMYGFRRSYLRSSIYVSTDSRAINIEADAYCGGRCEAYLLGSTTFRVFHLDVRSMYPGICTSTLLPVRLDGILGTAEPYRANSRGLYSRCIATADIETDEPAYPVRRNGIVVYPTGRFTTSLCGPELLDAIDKGRVVRIQRLAYYKMETAFHDYASNLFKLREEARTGQRKLCDSCVKHLLVAIIGKCGQRERGWRDVPSVWSDIQWGEWYGSDSAGNPCRYRSLGGHTQAEVDLGWSSQACPAIAAWICSQGRMILLNYIRIAGWENVLYVDTDSLYVTENGYDRLRISGSFNCAGIGALEQRDGPLTFRAIGIKHYDYGDRKVCAGLPRGHSQDTGDGYHFAWSPTPGSDIKRRARPESKLITLGYRTSGDYRHGIVMDDGRVIPHRLEEF